MTLGMKAVSLTSNQDPGASVSQQMFDGVLIIWPRLKLVHSISTELACVDQAPLLLSEVIGQGLIAQFAYGSDERMFQKGSLFDFLFGSPLGNKDFSLTFLRDVSGLQNRMGLVFNAGYNLVFFTFPFDGIFGVMGSRGGFVARLNFEILFLLGIWTVLMGQATAGVAFAFAHVP